MNLNISNILLLFVSCLIPRGENANILALFPLPLKSHFVMFERLLLALAENGHDVDVVTHFTPKNPPKGYNVLSLEGTLPILANNVSIDTFKHLGEIGMIRFITGTCGCDNCKAMFKTSVLQNLKHTKKKYDVVITEIFGSDCMLGFGYHFDIPSISMTSSIALPWASDRVGNPDNPSYIPTYFYQATSKMTFWERLCNTVSLIRSKILYKYWSDIESNRIAREFFGDSLPDLEDLRKNTSLVLVNSHFSINGVRPTVPNFIEVGGLHIKEPKRLSPHFEKLVTEDIQNGVIYLTMGSMILTETFPSDKLQGMFDALSELPYKILWKATREKFPRGLKIPANVHFEEWMPQMDVLCHPNVKLFISHGGLMGSQEAVYCGVPRLGIPLFADQENNIKHSEKLGLAIKVDYDDISKETVSKGIRELLNNQFYKNNAEKISSQFKDRLKSPLETAIFWVEYTIRHKGAPELRSSAVALPWYKYYLIDVALVFIIAVNAILYLLLMIIKINPIVKKIKKE